MNHPLWRPPQLHTQINAGHKEERKVTWLELFYDLVYVATLIQLGNMLSDDVSVTGFLQFVALFIPIWWSWTGLTFYTNRFVVDDVVHRTIVFAQIIGVATLGISIAGAFGDLANQFTLSYVFIRLILILLYVRAGRHVPEAKQLCDISIRGFSIAAAIWLLSLFVPAPLKYVFWAVGMLVDIYTPLSRGYRATQHQLPPDPPHMSERYGIFTIIVLGESFVKVLDEVSGQQIDVWGYVFSVFGIAVVSGLWWIYFDDIVEQAIKGIRGTYIWVYSHLPLALGLTAFGVAAKKVFIQPSFEPLSDKYRILYCVSVILALVFIAIIDLVTERHDQTVDNRHRAYWRFGAAGVVLLIALFGGFLSPIPFIIIMAVIFSIQIVIDLPSRDAPAPETEETMHIHPHPGESD